MVNQCRKSGLNLLAQRVESAEAGYVVPQPIGIALENDAVLPLPSRVVGLSPLPIGPPHARAIVVVHEVALRPFVVGGDPDLLLPGRDGGPVRVR